MRNQSQPPSSKTRWAEIVRLAISNIAWDIQEDEHIATLLNNHHVDAIDVAPGKYFPDPVNAKDADIAHVKHWWSEHGVEITGMQALLFGTSGLNVFGSQAVQQAMLAHLDGVCRVGAGLGATRLVFGSPKNRDRTGLGDEETLTQAVHFFQRAGDLAKCHGVTLCLEPNPTHYGANFMTNSDDTANVVRTVDHPAIRMQFDTGAITLNGESAEAVLAQHSSLIGHIHASEPDLLPLGDHATDHDTLYRTITQYLPTHVVSIEMVATKQEPHLASIERALTFARLHYAKQEGKSA